MPKNSSIGGISLEQQSSDDTDLKIIAKIAKNGSAKKRTKTPNDSGKHGDDPREAKKAIRNNQPEGIPIEIKEKEIETTGDACGGRGDRQSYLAGGLGVNNTSYSTSGTLGIVCYGDGTETYSPILVGSDHVMEGAPEMYQAGSEVVGTFLNRSQDEDVTAYKYNPDADADPEIGKIWGASDVTGTWTWDGLLEETTTYSSNTIDVTLSGMNSCTVDNEVIDIQMDGPRAKHQVDMVNRNAQGGDSGGPWIDNDGKLVAFHSGSVRYEIFGTVIDEWDVAAAGEEAIRAVNGNPWQL